MNEKTACSAAFILFAGGLLAGCGGSGEKSASYAISTSATSAAASGRTYLLKPGDYFTVPGTHIECFIRKETRSASSELITCALFKSVRSTNPIIGSYGFSIGQLGLTVERVDQRVPKILFIARYPASYQGVYAGNAPAPGVHKANLRSGDGVRVAHSDVGCIVLARSAGLTLWCKPVLSNYSKADPLEVGLNKSQIWVAHAGQFGAGVGPVAFRRKQPAP